MLKMRAAAKAEKNFAMSDRIRDELSALKVVIKDTKEGTEWSIEN
jgi:cysteinyl-tRNA synthetase